MDFQILKFCSTYLSYTYCYAEVLSMLEELQTRDKRKDGNPLSSSSSEIQNKIRKEVTELMNCKDGWDDLDGKAPSSDVIEDAFEFIKLWPFDVVIPEVELASNGTISLQVYDSERYTLGGVRFFNKHKGVYSVVDRRDPIDSNAFKSNDSHAILESLKKFRESISHVISQKGYQVERCT